VSCSQRPARGPVFSLLLLLVALAGCAAGGLPRKGWTHYRVGEVDFYSGAPQRRTEELLDAFAKFRVVTAKLTSASSVEPRLPTRVFMFPDQLSYQAHSSAKASGGQFAIRDGKFTLALDARQEAGVPELLLHEYTHLILANVGGANYPHWYHEGYAELMSSVRIVGNDVQLGRVPSHNVGAVADFSRWIPQEELIAGDIFTTRGDPERLHRAYAQAWTTVHYLLIGDPQRIPQLNAYLAAVSEGADPVATAREAFGMTMQEFEKLLRDYIRSRNVTYRLIPTSEFDFAEVELSPTPLTPAATAARLADMCWSIGNEELARKLAQSAVAAGESDPLPR
jgi:hypothetical protein